jgi:hypothetical protein
MNILIKLMSIVLVIAPTLAQIYGTHDVQVKALKTQKFKKNLSAGPDRKFIHCCRPEYPFLRSVVSSNFRDPFLLVAELRIIQIQTAQFTYYNIG